MKLVVTIEKYEDFFQGWIEGKGFVPMPFGKTIPDLINNLKTIVADYLEDKKNKQSFWATVDWDKVKFEFVYDMQDIFEAYSYLNFSKVADRVGIHKTMLTHLKNGERQATFEQANKIEEVLHDMGKELLAIRIVAVPSTRKSTKEKILKRTKKKIVANSKRQLVKSTVKKA